MGRKAKARAAEHTRRTSERVRLLIDLRPLENESPKVVESRIRNLWYGSRPTEAETAEA